MPDISMCTWKECPIGGNCYRLQAKPDERLQSYCDFSIEYSAKTKRCKFQIPLKEEKENGN